MDESILVSCKEQNSDYSSTAMNPVVTPSYSCELETLKKDKHGFSW